jgi:hypothetical protein
MLKGQSAPMRSGMKAKRGDALSTNLYQMSKQTHKYKK